MRNASFAKDTVPEIVRLGDDDELEFEPTELDDRGLAAAPPSFRAYGPRGTLPMRPAAGGPSDDELVTKPIALGAATPAHVPARPRTPVMAHERSQRMERTERSQRSEHSEEEHSGVRDSFLIRARRKAMRALAFGVGLGLILGFALVASAWRYLL